MENEFQEDLKAAWEALQLARKILLSEIEKSPEFNKVLYRNLVRT